jgi:hypothetical protein
MCPGTDRATKAIFKVFSPVNGTLQPRKGFNQTGRIRYRESVARGQELSALMANAQFSIFKKSGHLVYLQGTNQVFQTVSSLSAHSVLQEAIKRREEFPSGFDPGNVSRTLENHDLRTGHAAMNGFGHIYRGFRIVFPDK